MTIMPISHLAAPPLLHVKVSWTRAVSSIAVVIASGLPQIASQFPLFDFFRGIVMAAEIAIADHAHSHA